MSLSPTTFALSCPKVFQLGFFAKKKLSNLVPFVDNV